jgi:hypothetical protein
VAGFDDQPVLFTECDIELLDHERTGPLRGVQRRPCREFAIVFSDGGVRYPQRADPEDTMKIER